MIDKRQEFIFKKTDKMANWSGLTELTISTVLLQFPVIIVIIVIIYF